MFCTHLCTNRAISQCLENNQHVVKKEFQFQVRHSIHYQTSFRTLRSHNPTSERLYGDSIIVLYQQLPYAHQLLSVSNCPLLQCTVLAPLQAVLISQNKTENAIFTPMLPALHLRLTMLILSITIMLSNANAKQCLC